MSAEVTITPPAGLHLITLTEWGGGIVGYELRTLITQVTIGECFPLEDGLWHAYGVGAPADVLGVFDTAQEAINAVAATA